MARITCLPLRHSASQRDGSEQTVGELRGLLAVSLAAGSHTAALQWKAESADGSVPWYVLNGIGGFFQASLFECTINTLEVHYLRQKYVSVRV